MQVRRLPKRAAYDFAAIAEILDAGIVCHVGFVHDGAPLVIPMLYWRVGDRVYLHGSQDSRLLRVLCEAEVCVTVSHLDGIVLARSAFHHSVNYRSVAVVGRPELVGDERERERALNAFVERVAPNRWETLRPVTPKELALTRVVRMPLNEASAKVRTGPPIDDPGDLTWPCWAGVVPLTLVAGTPEPEPGSETLEPPALSL
jgi:uncharacterized protein